MEDRTCHICNQTDHIARRCPNKDKATHRPAVKPGLLKQASPCTTIVPYGNCTSLGVLHDGKGFQQPRRSRPQGATFGDLPVTHQEATQKLRKASKFAALIDDDEDADESPNPSVQILLGC